MVEYIDKLTFDIRSFYNEYFSEIERAHRNVLCLAFGPLNNALVRTQGKRAQYDLIRTHVSRAGDIFGKLAQRTNREAVMSISRSLPSHVFQEAHMTFYTMTAKYACSSDANNRDIQTPTQHGLELKFSGRDILNIYKMIMVSVATSRMQSWARWVGKGAALRYSIDGVPKLEKTDELTNAIETYERRRPRDVFFDSVGHFTPLAFEPPDANYFIPHFLHFAHSTQIEAPLGSGRHCGLERWPLAANGANLAFLLKGYDDVLYELFKVRSEHIMHFLVALTNLILHTVPMGLQEGEGGWFLPLLEPPQDFEHKFGFAFGLSQKGFLRIPRVLLIEQIGKSKTIFCNAPDDGRRKAEEFIDAFLFDEQERHSIDFSVPRFTPFLLGSSHDHIYVDLLLLWDFLIGLLERCKEWYSSAHGDRFTLDLKRWLDRNAPGKVVTAKYAVQLDGAGWSDVDLLIRKGDDLYLVECKAYGKSIDFMNGDPDAIRARRRKVSEAITQIDRISKAFGLEIANGRTSFPSDICIHPIVCTPSVEFLFPVDEFGLLASGIPRVLNPEELLQIIVDK